MGLAVIFIINPLGIIPCESCEFFIAFLIKRPFLTFIGLLAD